MKKRILSIVLTICLVLSFVLVMPTVALAADNVSYLDASGKSQKKSGVTLVTNSDTGWGTSGQTKWYVVNSNVILSGNVTVSGNVHLILVDGCTLTVNGSIKVDEGNSFTIYGQSAGSGTLNVNNTSDRNAGIGGGFTTTQTQTALGIPINTYEGNNSGAITINGGIVKATSKHGAAIGGGGGGTSTRGGNGTVTINGGTIIATSTGWAAAVGGGGSCTAGGAATVTINGGIVTAEATASGTSQATKGYAAAIGSGTNASANVTIKGGIVSAFAKGLGADIGTGATLTGGFPPTMSSGTESASITGGIVFRSDTGKVYGDTKLITDLTIESPRTLEIPSGTSLTIPVGKTLTLNRSISNSGSIYVDGTLAGINYATGNVYYRLTLVGCTGTGTTIHNGAVYCKQNTTVTLSATAASGQTYEWKTTPNTTVVNMFDNSFTMPSSALTVEAVFTQAVSITTQPSNRTASYGSNVDLTVVAVNADGKTNGLAYQWYRVQGVTWSKLTAQTDSTLTLSGLDVGTYEYFCRVSCDGTYVNSNKATVTVNRATDTVTIINAPSKTYDGQPAALAAEGYTVTGDGAVTVEYTKQGETNYSATPPTNAGNYTVRVTQAASTNCAEDSATMDFTISPKPVTVSGITGVDKTYDGTLTAGLNCANAEIAGKLEADTLTVSATGSFADKDVGTDKTVNITNLTLDGASKANYTLANEGHQATTTATISPKSVTVTIDTKSSACGAAIVELTATDNGIVSGDTNVYILSTTATSSSPVGSYDITGEGASANYSFTFENGTGAYTIVLGDLNDASVSLTGWTYGSEPNTPVVTGNAENADVSYQYKMKDADDSTYSDVVPIGAGAYTVKATIAASTNYNEKSVTSDFIIAPKILTITGLTATNRAYVSGNISVELSGGTLDGIVGNDDITATMPTTGTIANADAGENKTVTFGEITLTGTKVSNYTLTQPTVTVNISKADPDVGTVTKTSPATIYTCNPLNSITLSKTGSALGELKLTDNQTLTAGTADYSWTFAPTDTTNYKTVTGIIELEIVEGTWQSNGDGTHTHHCTVDGCNGYEDGNCSGGAASYFNKAVCDTCHTEYGELLTDSTAPTGEISIGTNKWNSFPNTITFGLFFKNTQSVTITASDDSYSHDGYTDDKAVKVEYYLHSGDIALTQADLASKTFTAYDDTFNINPDNKYVVYAKLTDHAGNVTYISSEGVVLDASAPVISGVENGKTYCSSQTFTVAEEYIASVKVNGAAVTLDENNQFTLPASGTQTIIVTDKAGNETSVTVTVNDGHTYEWRDDNGQYWKKCKFCGDETAKKDIPTITINGADAVCITQDYKFSFTLPEGATDAVYGYEFENKGDSGLPAIIENNELFGIVPVTEYEPSENSFKVYAGAKTADGFEFFVSKTIALKSEHIDAAPKDHICDVCGATLSEHTGGKTTCKNKPVCDYCGKEYGELAPNSHADLKHFPAKEATKTAEGNIEYWYCSGCGKYYKDATATKEIVKSDTVIAKLSDDSKSPQTGDNSHILLWFALLFVSGGLLSVTVVYGKRKTHSRN